MLYMDWGTMNAPFGEVNTIPTVRSLQTDQLAGPSMDSGADRIYMDGNHDTTAKAKLGQNIRETKISFYCDEVIPNWGQTLNAR